MIQSADNLLLIKPLAFGFDPKSADTNTFQQNIFNQEPLEAALKEHKELQSLLSANNIDYSVIESPKECLDGIFPNNWVITYEDKTMDLGSMYNPNRRLERSRENIDHLKQLYRLQDDYSLYEQTNNFLEGTGSLVLDRINKIAYMCLSPRSSYKVAKDWSKNRGYELITFEASLNKKSVYHTNVLMFIGSGIACIASNLIKDNKTVISGLEKHHKIIELSEEEIKNFCGNSLEVRDKDNNLILLMSSRAYKNYANKNIKELHSHYSKILHCNLNNIENIGGGSLRCMILELF